MPFKIMRNKPTLCYFVSSPFRDNVIYNFWNWKIIGNVFLNAILYMNEMRRFNNNKCTYDEFNIIYNIHFIVKRVKKSLVTEINS